MNKLTISFDMNKFNRHMSDIENYITKNILQEAPIAIRAIIVKEVLNQSNWNPEAVYSHLSSQSGKYDLNMSGQLLSTIGNESYNTISVDGKKVSIGIGNIEQLEQLRSQRELFGSPSPSAYSADAPYWRFVVFGHSPPKGDFTFARTGSVGGKDSGLITPGKPKMKGTPPTYMFENGLFVAKTEIDKVINQAITNTVKGLNAKWR